jgi:hypothetical protein
MARFIRAKYGKSTRLGPLVDPPPTPFLELVQAQLEVLRRTVPAEFVAEQWMMENRARRWTLMGVQSDRHYYDDQSLFYDYELLDRSLATPYRFRRDHRVYARIFAKLLPEMGSIPIGAGPPATAQPWRQWSHRVANKAAVRLGFRKPRALSYDFGQWVRDPLREFFTDLILDPRTRERDLWDGAAIRDGLERHIRGEASFAEEAALVCTAELFARRWVDGMVSRVP